jgi:hypothetical protein
VFDLCASVSVVSGARAVQPVSVCDSST